MQEVNVGIIGLGNVGSGTLAILTENAEQIALKLGFQLKVKALCSRSIADKPALPSVRTDRLPPCADGARERLPRGRTCWPPHA